MRLYLAGLLLAASMPATSQGQTRNTPFPGTMTLNVDATDTEQGILLTQTIPLSSSGPMTLNFSKWLPRQSCAAWPDREAGWPDNPGRRQAVAMEKRDPLDVYAFQVDVPAGARQLDLAFQFLSATEEDQGRIVVSPEIINLQWQSVSLYPAGWATRQIPVCGDPDLAERLAGGNGTSSDYGIERAHELCSGRL